MKILAIDLGKFKSVACVYDTASAQHTFTTIRTTPQAMHDLLAEHGDAARVVIEVCTAAGWIKDLCEAMGLAVEIANPNHEAWRWKNVKRKTDRDDALKLAQLSSMGQLPTVRLPDAKVRQWRSLIQYRATLVARRTAIKNHIRSLLDAQGIWHPSGKTGWTRRAMATLEAMARPLAEVDAGALWRGQLAMELRAYADVESLIAASESHLESLARADPRVKQLQTIPGVGPRLSELVVAMVDDPKRFRNAKQVGAYAGLVPRQYESGTMSRQGRITGRGNKLLRTLLVEISWVSQRYNPHLKAIYDRVCRGSKSRRKIAIVAVARRLLVICWAMLREGTAWEPPQSLTPS